jgi:hypothetical protein
MADHSDQMRRTSKRLPVGAALVAAAVLAAGTGSPAAAAPLASAAHTCSAPRYPGLGYFTSLTVYGTSCSTGDKVAFAYYDCRLEHGKAGTCHSAVLGFSCREKRNSIPTEIEARVTCRKDAEEVVHTYQQDT